MGHRRPPDLRSLLATSLARAKRIAILGIGSEFRGDDAAGMLVADLLARTPHEKSGPAVGVFRGSTAPENLTGEIRRFKPSHLVIIDTVDAGQKPGTILVVDPAAIGGAAFSTHTLPAAVLAGYLQRSTRCKTVIIGIQGRTLEFGDRISDDVRSSARYVAGAIRATVGKPHVRRRAA